MRLSRRELKRPSDIVPGKQSSYGPEAMKHSGCDSLRVSSAIAYLALRLSVAKTNAGKL